MLLLSLCALATCTTVRPRCSVSAAPSRCGIERLSVTSSRRTTPDHQSSSARTVRPAGGVRSSTHVQVVASKRPMSRAAGIRPGYVILLGAILCGLLILGHGRWYRYAQVTVLAVIGGWLLAGWTGLGVALSGLSVGLFLAEGFLRSRQPAQVRLIRQWDRYAAALREMRSDTTVIPAAYSDHTQPYFELRCVDQDGRVHPSTLRELVDWSGRRGSGVLALYGGFGTGKSTTCLEFCLALAEQRQDVLPIYLPVNAATSDGSDSEWLAEIIGERYGLLNRQADPRHAVAHDGHALVILDGLESIDDYFAHDVVGPLLSEVVQVGRARVLLAARRLAADLPTSEQSHVRPINASVSRWLGLLPMDADTRREYAATVHRPSVRIPRDDIAISADLDTLDRPFLIDLAYCATVAGTPVGSSLAGLYGAATDSMLEGDEREKGSRRDYAKLVLSAFAIQAYLLSEEQLPLDVAVTYIAAQVELDRPTLTTILNSCRLLTDHRGRVGFAHRSLEEYFVAVGCLEEIRRNCWDACRACLIIEPALGFLLDLLRAAPEHDLFANRIAAELSQNLATDTRADTSYLAANLASLMSGLGMPMCDMQFQNVSLTGATLRSADFRKTSFRNTDMSGTDLSGAKLSGARFERVDLRNTFMRSLDCTGTEFIDCDFWNLRWLDEPPSLWAARLEESHSRVVCATSTGHVVLASTSATGALDRAVTHEVGETGVLDVDIDDRTGTVLASDRSGRTVAMRLSPDGKSLTEIGCDAANHAANVRRIRFAPTGSTWYATASRDGFVRLFVRDSTVPHRQHGRHKAPVMDLAWHPDGRLLASGGYDGRLLLWDVVSDYTQQVSGPQDGDTSKTPLRGVAFSPSGRYVAAAGERGVIVQWEVDDHGVMSTPTEIGRVDSAVFALQYLSDAVVLAGTWRGEVVVVRDGETTCLWLHDDTVRSIDVARGKILTASWDGGIAIADQALALLFGPAVLPFPETRQVSESRFRGARMVRPTSLSQRYVRQFERLGVEVVEPGSSRRLMS